MWAYWLLFLVPVGVAFSPIKGDKNVRYMMWAIVGLLGVLLIGLRYEVGGDWTPYLTYLQGAQRGGFADVLLAVPNITNGSLYILLNWVAIQLGLGMALGIYFVNLVCGLIIMVGLIKFCQKQPMPWIALAVAMPYMVSVIAMGLTRQAVALGFLLWGLSFLREGTELKFVGLILIGSLFHLSLVVTLPLIAFTREKIFWWYYLLIGFFFSGLYFVMRELDLLGLYENVIDFYLRKNPVGASIRIYMNVLPVILSLIFWHRIKRISPDYRIIKWMAIAALISVPLLDVSSALVDRFAMYLMPLQVALWPRLIAVQTTTLMRSTWASMIIVYYGLVLFVWFNFAVHARYWVPYRMWPFTSETIYQPIERML